jgi:hypothetical protein
VVTVIVFGFWAVRWGSGLPGFAVVVSTLLGVLAAAAGRQAGDEPGGGKKKGEAFTGHGGGDRLRWNHCRS